MSRKVTGSSRERGRLKVTGNQRKDSEVTLTNYLHQTVGNLEQAMTPAVGKNPGKRLHIFF